MEELKNCPFCGGKGMWVGISLSNWCVWCEDCLSEVRQKGYSPGFKTKKQAIKAWNTRTAPEPEKGGKG